MFNLVVGGDCKDGYGFKINTHYQVYYRETDITSNIVTTTDRRIVFNTNDIDHLGYMGNLPNNTPLYVIGWQGGADKTNLIRSCRKRILFNGQSTIVGDFILDENKYVTTNITSISNSRTHTLNPNVSTNGTVKNVIYYVYYDINSVSFNSAEGNDWKLVKTITVDNLDAILVTYKTNGKFKIECEAVIDNDEASLCSFIIEDVNNDNISISGQRYIEWE